MKETYPSLNVQVLEKRKEPNAFQTWSFHETDLSKESLQWVRPLISKSWEGHRVEFPKFSRVLGGTYHSIHSKDYFRHVRNRLGINLRYGSTVREIHGDRVLLNDGTWIEGHCVFDGTGWETRRSLPQAYQKFVGLNVELSAPHGEKIPILMDATVSQEQGYRFFYVLPWSDRRLLVEDTYYSDSTHLDENRAKEDILEYCEKRGWKVACIESLETGKLPIPLQGMLPTWKGSIPRLGVAAGLFHPTTSYSFPHAVRLAEWVSSEISSDPENLSWNLRLLAEAHWARSGFFRFLNRMMFRAAPPTERYLILQRFYSLNENLINRFYAEKLTLWDKVRILWGRPPVNVGEAIRCVIPDMGLGWRH